MSRGMRYGSVTTRWSTITADDWRDDAACRDIDPETFFVIGDSTPAVTQIRRAKSVCARCDVREKCLNWAIEVKDAWAVAGGMTPAERAEYSRRAVSQ